MKSRLSIVLIVILAVGTFFVGRSFSGDEKPQGMQMTPEQQAQMAEYMKYATPDDHHKALDQMVGKWTFASKFWMDPNSPMQESKGTSEAKWILGGRYVQENVTGEMMGGTFNGIGITGYDLIKKEYVNYWMDDMSTAPMASKGQMDAAGKVVTFVGWYPDVMQGMKDIKYKTVEKLISANEHVMEMYMVGDDGKEFKTMEITYTRAK